MGLIDKKELSYLALGDSYTIGELVHENERWPVLLSQKTVGDRIYLKKPQIIATTGWTTDELKLGIANASLERRTFDMVSLLIGVNNQYRGYPISQYDLEFEELLLQAIAFSGGDSNNVFVVSIPDYGVTPFAIEKEPDVIARELDAYNTLAGEVCARYKVDFLNITPLSREALHDSELIASDGLHPSGKMYKKWVDEIILPWYHQKIQ